MNDLLKRIASARTDFSDEEVLAYLEAVEGERVAPDVPPAAPDITPARRPRARRRRHRPTNPSAPGGEDGAASASLAFRVSALVDADALKALVGELVREVLADRHPPEGDVYLSVARAAGIVDVAPATIREWIAQGRLGRYHAGRELRVKAAELDALLNAGPTSDGAQGPEERARAELARRRRAS
jgi:excisionase family DNA binding protein